MPADTTEPRARSRACADVEGAPRGSPVVAGRRAVTPAADMWSLGCVLAEAATGHLLFPADNPAELLDMVKPAPTRAPTPTSTPTPTEFPVAEWRQLP